MNEVVVKVEPKWVRKRDALKIFSIGHRKLLLWTGQGFIRQVKISEEKQSTHLYYVPDIETHLLRLAAGFKPIPKIGKRKP